MMYPTTDYNIVKCLLVCGYVLCFTAKLACFFLSVDVAVPVLSDCSLVVVASSMPCPLVIQMLHEDSLRLCC